MEHSNSGIHLFMHTRSQLATLGLRNGWWKTKVPISTKINKGNSDKLRDDYDRAIKQATQNHNHKLAIIGIKPQVLSEPICITECWNDVYQFETKRINKRIAGVKTECRSEETDNFEHTDAIRAAPVRPPKSDPLLPDLVTESKFEMGNYVNYGGIDVK